VPHTDARQTAAHELAARSNQLPKPLNNTSGTSTGNVRAPIRRANPTVYPPVSLFAYNDIFRNLKWNPRAL